MWPMTNAATASSTSSRITVNTSSTASSLCELSPMERSNVVGRTTEFLHNEQDQFLIIRVGPESLDWTNHLACVGKGWTPEVRSNII